MKFDVRAVSLAANQHSGFLIFYFYIFLRFLARSQNCEKRFKASLCPSVRMEQLGSHWTDFDKTWYLVLFRNSVEKNLNFIKIRQKQLLLYMKTFRHF